MEVNSLPPRVKGDIRFFLSLRVQGLERCSPLNRLKLSWWGDKSEYTLAENIEVKFPVLCAKKQFLQYLADSGVIVLHLMDSNGATKGCAFVNCFPLKDSLNLNSEVIVKLKAYKAVPNLPFRIQSLPLKSTNEIIGDFSVVFILESTIVPKPPVLTPKIAQDNSFDDNDEPHTQAPPIPHNQTTSDIKIPSMESQLISSPVKDSPILEKTNLSNPIKPHSIKQGKENQSSSLFNSSTQSNKSVPEELMKNIYERANRLKSMIKIPLQKPLSNQFNDFDHKAASNQFSPKQNFSNIPKNTDNDYSTAPLSNDNDIGFILKSEPDMIDNFLKFSPLFENEEQKDTVQDRKFLAQILFRIGKISGIKLQLTGIELLEDAKSISFDLLLPNPEAKTVHLFKKETRTKASTSSKIDFQLIVPLLFDSEMAEQWLHDHIIFKLTVVYLRRTAMCTAGISCLKLLNDNNDEWNGSLNIFDSEKSSSTKVGTLRCKLRIIGDTKSNFSKSVFYNSSTELPIVSENLLFDWSSSRPVYFFMYVSQVKKIDYELFDKYLFFTSKFCFSNGNFMDSAIFHIESNTVNINHKVTSPIPMNDRLFKTCSNCPAILEFWVSPSSHSQKKESLFGLAKLPANNMFSALIQYLSNIKDSSPLIIPENDYNIIDPLTGEVKGAVTCVLALGILDDLRALESLFVRRVSSSSKIITDSEVSGGLFKEKGGDETRDNVEGKVSSDNTNDLTMNNLNRKYSNNDSITDPELLEKLNSLIQGSKNEDQVLSPNVEKIPFIHDVNNEKPMPKLNNNINSTAPNLSNNDAITNPELLEKLNNLIQETENENQVPFENSPVLENKTNEKQIPKSNNNTNTSVLENVHFIIKSAQNIPWIYSHSSDHKTSLTKVAAPCFVKFCWPNNNFVCTKVCQGPIHLWNESFCFFQDTNHNSLTKLLNTKILLQIKSVINSIENTIGTATIDVSALVFGLSYIDGWYQIVDSQQRPAGEIKIRIEPMTSFSILPAGVDSREDCIRASSPVRFNRSVTKPIINFAEDDRMRNSFNGLMQMNDKLRLSINHPNSQVGQEHSFPNLNLDQHYHPNLISQLGQEHSFPALNLDQHYHPNPNSQVGQEQSFPILNLAQRYHPNPNSQVSHDQSFPVSNMDQLYSSDPNKMTIEELGNIDIPVFNIINENESSHQLVLQSASLTPPSINEKKTNTPHVLSDQKDEEKSIWKSDTKKFDLALHLGLLHLQNQNNRDLNIHQSVNDLHSPQNITQSSIHSPTRNPTPSFPLYDNTASSLPSGFSSPRFDLNRHATFPQPTTNAPISTPIKPHYTGNATDPIKDNEFDLLLKLALLYLQGKGSSESVISSDSKTTIRSIDSVSMYGNLKQIDTFALKLGLLHLQRERGDESVESVSVQNTGRSDFIYHSTGGSNGYVSLDKLAMVIGLLKMQQMDQANESNSMSPTIPGATMANENDIRNSEPVITNIHNNYNVHDNKNNVMKPKLTSFSKEDFSDDKNIGKRIENQYNSKQKEDNRVMKSPSDNSNKITETADKSPPTNLFSRSPTPPNKNLLKVPSSSPSKKQMKSKNGNTTSVFSSESSRQQLALQLQLLQVAQNQVEELENEENQKYGKKGSTEQRSLNSVNFPSHVPHTNRAAVIIPRVPVRQPVPRREKKQESLLDNKDEMQKFALKMGLLRVHQEQQLRTGEMDDDNDTTKTSILNLSATSVDPTPLELLNVSPQVTGYMATENVNTINSEVISAQPTGDYVPPQRAVTSENLPLSKQVTGEDHKIEPQKPPYNLILSRKSSLVPKLATSPLAKAAPIFNERESENRDERSPVTELSHKIYSPPTPSNSLAYGSVSEITSNPTISGDSTTIQMISSNEISLTSQPAKAMNRPISKSVSFDSSSISKIDSKNSKSALDFNVKKHVEDSHNQDITISEIKNIENEVVSNIQLIDESKSVVKSDTGMDETIGNSKTAEGLSKDFNSSEKYSDELQNQDRKIDETRNIENGARSSTQLLEDAKSFVKTNVSTDEKSITRDGSDNSPVLSGLKTILDSVDNDHKIVRRKPIDNASVQQPSPSADKDSQIVVNSSVNASLKALLPVSLNADATERIRRIFYSATNSKERPLVPVIKSTVESGLLPPIFPINKALTNMKRQAMMEVSRRRSFSILESKLKPLLEEKEDVVETESSTSPTVKKKRTNSLPGSLTML